MKMIEIGLRDDPRQCDYNPGARFNNKRKQEQEETKNEDEEKRRRYKTHCCWESKNKWKGTKIIECTTETKERKEKWTGNQQLQDWQRKRWRKPVRINWSLIIFFICLICRLYILAIRNWRRHTKNGERQRERSRVNRWIETAELSHSRTSSHTHERTPSSMFMQVHDGEVPSPERARDVRKEEGSKEQQKATAVITESRRTWWLVCRDKATQLKKGPSCSVPVWFFSAFHRHLFAVHHSLCVFPPRHACGRMDLIHMKGKNFEMFLARKALKILFFSQKRVSEIERTDDHQPRKISPVVVSEVDRSSSPFQSHWRVFVRRTRFSCFQAKNISKFFPFIWIRSIRPQGVVVGGKSAQRVMHSKKVPLKSRKESDRNRTWWSFWVR